MQILCFGLVVMLCSCSRPPDITAALAERMLSADMAVLDMEYGKTGESGSFTRRAEVSAQVARQIAKAIVEAKRDRGVYDTPVGAFRVRLYHDGDLLITIHTCSDLFLYDGKQYRAADNVLSRHVDDVLYEVPERRVDLTD